MIRELENEATERVCIHHLLGLHRSFDHEPALDALRVLHLQHVVTQVFSGHCHETLLALQGDRRSRWNNRKVVFLCGFLGLK